MAYVRSALTCVLIVALTAAVQGQLVHTKYEKYTRYLSALILLCVLVAPVRSIMEELENEDFSVDPTQLQLSEAGPQDYLLSLVSREIESDIEAMLIERYGLTSDQIGGIEATIDASDPSNLKPATLWVSVKADADADTEAIRKDIEERYDCESVSVIAGA
ncbi:MAG: hypothetical protein ACI3XR_06150 [Eubacteriales bacterium]